jgi:hypothetical protein
MRPRHQYDYEDMGKRTAIPSYSCSVQVPRPEPIFKRRGMRKLATTERQSSTYGTVGQVNRLIWLFTFRGASRDKGRTT